MIEKGISRRDFLRLSALTVGSLAVPLAGCGDAPAGRPPSSEPVPPAAQVPDVEWAESATDPWDVVVSRYDRDVLYQTPSGIVVTQYAEPTNNYIKIVYVPPDQDRVSLQEGIEWVITHCNGSTPAEEFRRRSGGTVAEGIGSIPFVESITYFPRDSQIKPATLRFVQYDPEQSRKDNLIHVKATYPATYKNPYLSETSIGAAYIVAGSCDVNPVARIPSGSFKP